MLPVWVLQIFCDWSLFNRCSSGSGGSAGTDMIVVNYVCPKSVNSSNSSNFLVRNICYLKYEGLKFFGEIDFETRFTSRASRSIMCATRIEKLTLSPIVWIYFSIKSSFMYSENFSAKSIRFVFNFILVLQHFSEKITQMKCRVQNRMLCSVILIGEYIRNRMVVWN